MRITARIVNNVGTVVSLTAGDEVVGVVLRREIQNNVKVRPTNVTANIGSIPSTATSINEPDFILLHNGPKGGFTQTFIPGTDGDYLINDVIGAVIVRR